MQQSNHRMHEILAIFVEHMASRPQGPVLCRNRHAAAWIVSRIQRHFIRHRSTRSQKQTPNARANIRQANDKLFDRHPQPSCRQNPIPLPGLGPIRDGKHRRLPFRFSLGSKCPLPVSLKQILDKWPLSSQSLAGEKCEKRLRIIDLELRDWTMRYLRHPFTIVRSKHSIQTPFYCSLCFKADNLLARYLALTIALTTSLGTSTCRTTVRLKCLIRTEYRCA